MTVEEFRARLAAIRERVTKRVMDPEYERVRQAAADMDRAARAAEIARIVERQRERDARPHWAEKDEEEP